jgi:hypothetical protein
VRANFGWPQERNYRSHCSLHKLKGMVNVNTQITSLAAFLKDPYKRLLFNAVKLHMLFRTETSNVIDISALVTRQQAICCYKCQCPAWFKLARKYEVNILIIIMGAYYGNPYRSYVFDISRSYIILVWDNTQKLYSAQISQDLLNGAKYFWTYSELSQILRGEFFELQQIVTGVKRLRSSPVNIPPISDLIQKLFGYNYLPTSENPPNCEISGENHSLDNAIVYSVSPQLVVAAIVPQIVVVVDPIVIVASAAPIVLDLLQQRFAERLADLTAEQRAYVTAALSPPHDEVLVENFGIPLTRSIVSCLNPKLRLNDEIINYYMQLLQEWDKRLCEADPTRKPSHFFNLFFMSKLLQSNKYTYANVKR